MKGKRTLAIALVGALLFTVVSPIVNQNNITYAKEVTQVLKTGTVLNVKTAANVRADATASSPIIDTIKKYETVEIIGEKGSFYEINLASGTGYVSKALIEADEKLQGTYYNGSPVNIRKGPGTGYGVIRYLPSSGTEFEVINDFGNWAKIKIDGEYGYISSRYIYATTTGEVKGTGTVLNVNSSANIRHLPDSTSAIMTTAPKYSTVIIAGEENGYYRIYPSGGAIGYIHKSLVELDTPAYDDYNKYEVVGVKSALNMRTGPGSTYSAITTIPLGDTVEYVEQFGDWVKVRYDVGIYVYGYVHSKYLSKI